MSTKFRKYALSARDVRWTCPKKLFRARESAKLEPLDKIVGQDRAIRAITLGLAINSPGFNIFIAGLTGTGRSTTIKKLLEQIDGEPADLQDICYVHNFSKPDCPNLLYLPAGQGKALQRDLSNAVSDILQAIPLIFESDYFRTQAKELLNSFGRKTRELFQALEKKAHSEGLEIVNVEQPSGTMPQLVPVVEGRAVNWDELFALVQQKKFPQKQFDALQKSYAALSEELHNILTSARKLNIEADRRLKILQQKSITPYVHTLFKDMRSLYAQESAHVFLDEAEKDLLSRFVELVKMESVDESSEEESEKPDHLLKFRVNVLIDNAAAAHKPVVVEKFPSHRNLFGSIDRTVEPNGMLYTDFTRIRAGSLIQANGGYLVLNLTDTLLEPGVWTRLKRALKHGQTDIHHQQSEYLAGSMSLKPAPVDLNVKVIIIGDAYYYSKLSALDNDFQNIFKIRADFDTSMPLTDEAVYNYGRFISKITREEGLLPFEASGMAAIAEFGVRLAAHRQRITTKFSKLADVLREADFWAREAGNVIVSGADVDRAQAERDYRSNLYEEKVREYLREGRILLMTEGTKTGQINGLSVHSYGYHRFGRPNRITCEVGVGQAGIISIDREADLSGKSHRKGIAIISGYFRGQYGGQKPVNMSVSLTFEQLYGFIDGDSASSTEIYCILSALGQFPLRQDLAVTGSVSQKGEIQPIGGVNEKVEGFFSICMVKGGLTGTQGVVIPRANVDNLMLSPEVETAIRERRFHLYAIEHINQGIEILSGLRAGERNTAGEFPAKSVHGLVEARLRELAEGAKAYANESGRGNGKPAGGKDDGA